jgi:uncharacterized protein YidB (DUF937 family)
MGLLDLASRIFGALSSSGDQRHAGLIDAIGGLINDQEGGGLQGLVRTFEENGLGREVASWVGQGQNLPSSAEQLEAVLGSGQIRAIADKLGFSPQETSGHLAELLPQVVDKLTPGGQIPESGGLGPLLGMLKGWTG